MLWIALSVILVTACLVVFLCGHRKKDWPTCEEECARVNATKEYGDGVVCTCH
jgi:hypothetical protein